MAKYLFTKVKDRISTSEHGIVEADDKTHAMDIVKKLFPSYEKYYISFDINYMVVKR